MSSLPRSHRRTGAAAWQMLVLVGAVIAIGFSGYRMWTASQAGKVSYPYYCKDCHAVFDVSELGVTAEKWRTPPGESSDSVVYCLRCKTGTAYPAAKCPDCGTVHLMHAWKNSACPKCNPEVGKAAAAEGINLTPKELK